MPHIEVTPKGLQRLASGHRWVFASDLKKLKDTPGVPGIVAALSRQGERLGQGLYNPQSKIAFRLLTRGEESTDEAFFEARTEAAIRYREQVVEGFEAYRVIHSEADGLPGLTVDRYGEVLVVQQHAAALEPFMPAILAQLKTRFKPRGILGRNDSLVRALEGLTQQVAPYDGEVPERLVFQEGEVRLLAAPYTGQKTGAFLDQRENHVFAGAVATGRALDVFAYHGGFALQLARRADSVLAVDASAAALEAVTAGASLNGFDNVTVRQANAFDLLRSLAGADERFDTIVLDPPAFAKSKSHVPKALSAYKEINLRALSMLSSGGILLTASCSHHVSSEDFYAMLTDAAADACRQVRVLARCGQASCHPEVLGMPESYYLKLAALEVTEVF